MTDPKNRRNRLIARGAAAGVLALTAGGVGVAQAAANPPPLSFVAATQSVTATRYHYGDEVWLDFDLGLHVIAGNDPFEIRAKRTGYDKPIAAEQRITKKGSTRTVPLPAGLVPDFNGLKDFTKFTIADASGATIRQYSTPFCANSWSSARTRPDAPATTPYPTQCGGWNPFTLGAVWGIQAGWDSAVQTTPVTGEFDLQPGKYQVTAVLNPTYQKLFGVQAAQSTVKIAVTVVDEDINKTSLAKIKAAKAEAAASPGELQADRQGGQQVSEFVPGLRAPGKRPATLKAAPKSGPRPDLRSLPAWGISLAQGQNEETGETDGKWYINFGATVWNGGTSPLLVDGFRRSGTELMDAYQYFFDAHGNQVGSQQAGTMQWDDRVGHKHWHFTDFAQYNLLAADKKLAVRSGKEAFCLANTDAVDYTLPNAKWRPDNTDLSTSCGANTVVAVREVLDIGNGDTYSQDRPGQSFEVTDLPNGTYYIQVLANPVKKLAELDTTNNSALREVILGGTPENRTLTVPPVNGIEG
ncbi:lysyl oxidase family protein [Actinoplanes sp. CA-030573]|uniref:lysyl oxidase family protein n=1 Tax=Actinoplanes sp. CA-030573 TaxID=3239898 RepID=UPI003D920ABF